MIALWILAGLAAWFAVAIAVALVVGPVLARNGRALQVSASDEEGPQS